MATHKLPKYSTLSSHVLAGGVERDETGDQAE